MSFLEGFGIGLGMIIFIGPVFFLLLNSALQYGVKAGLAVVFGIIISDIVCVALCYYGLSSLMIIKQNQFWIGGVGSILLLILGISYLMKKAKKNTESTIYYKGMFSFFIKGFSINFFNPFVFVVWIGVYNYGQHRYPESQSLLLFIGSVLLGIFCTDIAKVILSKRVQKIVSSKNLTVFFKVTGVILILFSIRLLFWVW